jgi:hypothetical protein
VIRHIVLFRLNGETPERRAEQADLLAHELELLNGSIPGLVGLRVTADLGASESNWHLALVSVHTSTKDLDIYMSHPLHVAVKEITSAHTTERAIVDSRLRA